ncbi:hypothetical protein BJF83_21475 [Nocardiopsis sp. CNR-923]|uniref:hypothetical protein n=1 Tax=Nocardiopsis sp. CNR-923 TaxID=1904965 RepID=UPI0009675265|nr:hypothetical protein [Nocardiopsis sp. CNR-923]OLT26374.1 hypothetical protein BJF83_21475 [Nocardiopsis sp. CNR-923]
MADAPTVHDIKPGNIVSVPSYHGGEDTVTACAVYEYDGFVYVTDETGYQWTLAPHTPVRFIHR